MIKYSKIPIALEYLEAAIDEREIHKRYFSAMNLAGVAEELLGKIVRIIGKKDQLTETAETLLKIQNKVKPHFDFNLGFTTTKEFKNLIKSTKNSIKHINSSNDLDAKLYFEVEDESKWMIQAAIRNLNKLDIKYTDRIQQFMETHPEE